MSVKTISENVVLQVISCKSCGVVFALPKIMLETFQQYGGYYHCPNGHSWGWEKKNSQSENDRLRAELDKTKENEKWWRSRKYEADERTNRVERQLSAKKGQITKLNKRIVNGVCPCCNRTFVQLARHMKSQHPDFQEKGDEQNV